MNPALIWIIAALALLIIEMMSGTVALLCLGAGCIIASLVALAGLDIVWQASLAAATAVVIFFVCGTKIKNYYANMRRHHKDTSNMEAIIGREGRVTNPVTANYTDGGRVQIDGDNWQAYTESPERPIPVGGKVVVESYDSIVIRVRPAKN